MSSQATILRKVNGRLERFASARRSYPDYLVLGDFGSRVQNAVITSALPDDISVGRNAYLRWARRRARRNLGRAPRPRVVARGNDEPVGGRARDATPGAREAGPLQASFYLDAAFEFASLRAALSRLGLNANVVITQGKFLDHLPLRASKGRAVYYLANKLKIPLVRVLAAGDSGNDRDMLETAGHAVVVANHAPELADLRGYPTVLFSAARGAEGILDGIRYHRLPMKAHS